MSQSGLTLPAWLKQVACSVTGVYNPTVIDHRELDAMSLIDTYLVEFLVELFVLLVKSCKPGPAMSRIAAL